MTAATRHAASAAISDRLLAHSLYRTASCVSAYSSFGSEFDTSAFIENALASGKRLLMPRVDTASRALTFHQVRDPIRDLKPGVWGIREPDPARCPGVETDAVDFMLVPGVAFTPACERLGYGGGFYDAVIARLSPRAFKAAAAFSVQIVDALPADAWDRSVDAVITERDRYGKGA